MSENVSPLPRKEKKHKHKHRHREPEAAEGAEMNSRAAMLEPIADAKPSAPLFTGPPPSTITINVGDEKRLYEDVVKEEMKSKGEGYWATQVDVRKVNYKAEVPATPVISTIKTMWSKPQMETKTILNDINFSLLPYEATILLGRPRSGKTSLLDILGFRRTGDISGTVNVNGAHREENYHRLVSYVQQGDVNLPLLTVKETFTFSANCQLDDKSRVAGKVEEVTQLLGLKHAENTVVGDEMTRGVSGGERRRVTIGVEWVKDSSFYLLDEPTTGLDSGAASNIGQTLRILSRKGSPVLAALLQPSWELVQQFDKVIILSDGAIGYWGPVNEAIPYFDALGYSCPTHYSAAEFLAEVVDSPERFPLDPEKPRSANTSRELIDAYCKSDMFRRMLAEATASGEKIATSKGAHNGHEHLDLNGKSNGHSKGRAADQEYHLGSVFDATHSSKYPRSRIEQLKLLLWRGGLNYIRDWKRELQNILANVFIAIVTGLIFLRLNNSIAETSAKLSLIFFLVLKASFAALSGIAAMFIDRPVFYRQRAGHYYAVLPWVISSFSLGIPMMLMECILFPTICYWMGGLRPEAGPYFFVLLQCFTISICFVGYVRFWGSLMPGPILASIIAATFAGILITFSGFLIQRPRIPAAWRWFFWLSPFSYGTLLVLISLMDNLGYSALAISQFGGASINCADSEMLPPRNSLAFNLSYPVGFQGNRACPIADGDAFLTSVGLYNHKPLMWVFYAATVGWTIFYSGLFYLAIRRIDFSGLRVVTGINDVSEHLRTSEKATPATHASTLSWENLTYTVPTPKGPRVILDKVNGYVKPGMLLALMGASGAGKTTLLDVLARRKNVGTITGKVLVDGREPDSSYRRLIGYVEQTDMHFTHQTVLEAIEFAAECRLPATVSKEQRLLTVNRTLDLLNLRTIAGAYIGWGGQWGGINAEERKRLSMAVELVAEPAILFLDEPTSGLDSNAADVVMTAIQKVAQSGTSVICTIHQPSTRIFNRATHLLLLKKGGKVVYFGDIGEESQALVGYFSKQQIKPTPGQNPADFVLAASLGQAGKQEEEVLKAWQDAPESRAAVDEIHNVEAHPPQQSADYEHLLAELRKSYATSFGRQLILHIKRWSLSYWRNPSEFIMTIARCLLLGFVFGTVFWNRPYDQLGAAERFAVLFLSALNASLTAFSYLPMVFIQRPIFYRERSERMYRTATYALGYIISDLPMIVLGSVVFAFAFYWWTGLQRDFGKFMFYVLVSTLIAMVSIMFVQMIGAVFARPDTAGLIFSSVFIIFGSAAGFLIPPKKIPQVVRWLYWISFPRYFIESVSVNEFAGSHYHCSGGGFPVPIAGTDNTLAYCSIAQSSPVSMFGLHLDFKWVGVGVLTGYYLLFAVIYILALQFINHIKR